MARDPPAKLPTPPSVPAIAAARFIPVGAELELVTGDVDVVKEDEVAVKLCVEEVAKGDVADAWLGDRIDASDEPEALVGLVGGFPMLELVTELIVELVVEEVAKADVADAWVGVGFPMLELVTALGVKLSVEEVAKGGVADAWVGDRIEPCEELKAVVGLGDGFLMLELAAALGVELGIVADGVVKSDVVNA